MDHLLGAGALIAVAISANSPIIRLKKLNSLANSTILQRR
jgi:hypothetical protein